MNGMTRYVARRAADGQMPFLPSPFSRQSDTAARPDVYTATSDGIIEQRVVTRQISATFVDEDRLA